MFDLLHGPHLDTKPREIIIALTNICNQSCTFCYQADRTSKKYGKFLSREAIFTILADVHKAKIPAVRFTGGEPFLHPDFGAILYKAKELNLYTIVNTNGINLKKSTLTIIRSIDLLLISFHKPRALHALKRKLKLLNNLSTKVILATILTPANINVLEQFYKCFSYFKPGIASDWFFLRPIPTEFNKKPISFAQLKNAYSKIISLNQKYNQNVKIANALPFCALKEDLPSICRGGRFDSGYTRIFIDPYGNYKPDYCSRRTLGNICRSIIMKIWNSPYLKDVRAYKKIHADCFQCVYLARCKGGLLSGEYLIKQTNLRHIVAIRHILSAGKKLSFMKQLALLKGPAENTCRIINLAVTHGSMTPAVLKKIILIHQEFDVIWKKNNVYHAFRIDNRIKNGHVLKKRRGYFLHSVKNNSLLLKEISIFLNTPIGIFTIRKEILNNITSHPKC